MSTTHVQPSEPAPASTSSLYGLLAEFETPEQIVAAARSTYQSGYRKIDAYAPFPVDDLAEVMGMTRNRVPLVVLLGGIAGGLTAYGMQYFSAVIHYPLNIGGRPYHSWPSFLPVTFELTVLLASFSAVVGMLVMNGLPRPHQPIFNSQRFARASQDRYFLLIEARDPQFDLAATRQFLQGLNPLDVSELES